MLVIPYYAPPSLHLGPVTLEPFGVFVAAGILLATYVLGRAAQQEGLDPRPLADYAIYGLISGVVLGHWVHLLAYHPEELSKSPFQVFKVWEGLSSFGGLLGGILAAVVFFRIRGVSFMRYADAFALAVAPGWAVARLGCFAVHDHPGVRTTFPLAVNFPQWGPRHDLGLYDAGLLFALTGLLWALRKRKLLTGRLLPLLGLLYGIGRFAEDFLRATDLSYVDKRYLGLTPAQYGCMALMAYGVWGLVRKLAPQGPDAGAGAATPRSA